VGALFSAPKMLAGLTLALLLGDAAPCGPLDLDAAVALAMDRSDELRIRRAEAAAAGVDESLARALRILPEAQATVVVGPAPAARGDVVSSPDSNRSLKDLGPFGRIDVTAVQPLYTWGRLDAAADAAAAGRRARLELVGDTEGQLRLRVVQLFGGVELAKRLLALAEDVQKALGTARTHVDDALASRSGEVTLSDKHRLEVFSALVAVRAAEAAKGKAQARIGLAATLGLDPAALVLVEQPLPTEPGGAADGAVARADALARRHDLRALDEAIRAREAEIVAEEAALKPQLFAAGQVSLGYAPNRDVQKNPWVRDEFNAFTVGVVLGVRQDLAIPLRSAQARKAAAERATLLTQREGLARLVSAQVDGAVAELEGARARLAAAQAGLQASRALFRASSLDFGVGLIEARALIEGYGLYVESQVAAAQAGYDLLVARARLDQATGAPPPKGPACTP
jgi:outer membrane protein TolC